RCRPDRGGGRRGLGVPAAAILGRGEPGRGATPRHGGAGRAGPAPGPALAVAASTVDGGTPDAVRAVLLRDPDLLGSAGEDVTALATSPDGRTVGVGTGSGGVFLYTGASLSQRVQLSPGGAGAVAGLAFTPDGHRMASWGGAGIAVWD